MLKANIACDMSGMQPQRGGAGRKSCEQSSACRAPCDLDQPEKSTLWLTWTRTAETMSCEVLLASVGVASSNKVIGLICACSSTDLKSIIGRWSSTPPNLLTLAEHVQPKCRRKYDEYLHDDLLDEGIARGCVGLARSSVIRVLILNT